MGFWENARGDKDLDRVRQVHQGIIRAQQANDLGDPVDMTEVTVRVMHYDHTWEEVPVIIPTDLLSVACRLAVSYQNAAEYPVLHVDGRMPNEGHGRYITFTNDAQTVIELRTKPHIPEQNQDDRRRAKLRGNRAQNLGNPDPVDFSDFAPRASNSVAPE
ncbi:hypothetical protein SEA_KEANU_64 [Streptomyces phage Keanu]|nr:hypothetical protein SEA_KEANU_64 [Streptomyces phage Keanu]